MIVFDASSVVGAALTRGGVPERAMLHAIAKDALALSPSVDAEISEVLGRAKFFKVLPPVRRDAIISLLRTRAVWFEPTTIVTDCRDSDDNKYLELALTARAEIIVTSDNVLLMLHPWHGILIMTPARYLAFVGAM